jgi:CRISPR-associated protein Csx17
MAGHILELRGCTPEPLGNYLKGLGIFRLIAEQADPQARAWWKDGVLWLHTKWSRDEVVSFFLHGIGEQKTPIYSPTPIFAPWGGRPGFYADGNKKAKALLKTLTDLPDSEVRFLRANRIAKIIAEVLSRRTAVVSEKKKQVTKFWVDSTPISAGRKSP